MTEIASSLEQRCKELAQEIATLQNYNMQWLEIQAAAESEDGRVEAINAIKTNNNLIGEKTFQVNEILEGRNPFAVQELPPENIPESLPDLNVEAKIRKVRYFNLPFQRLLYKSSSISVTASEVQLRPSINRLLSSESDLVIIQKGEISSVDSDGIEVKLQTESHGKYSFWVANSQMALYLRYRLQAFVSESGKQAENEGMTFYDEIMESNKTAWATPLLITINVAVFGLMVTQGYGVFSPDTQMATKWGGLEGPLTLNGEWWRILTYMFLHYGVLHLVLNMNVLWVVGPLTERLFGSTKFLFLYLLSGTIAAIVSIWYAPLKVGVGASGSIFGLIGATTAIALIPKLRPPTYMAKRLISAGIFFVVVNGAIGLSIPLVDNAAHFGGLIGGAIIGLILASPARSTSKNDLNFELTLRLLAAMSVIAASCYFLLLNNTGIQKELRTQKSETLYKQG